MKQDNSPKGFRTVRYSILNTKQKFARKEKKGMPCGIHRRYKVKTDHGQVVVGSLTRVHGKERGKMTRADRIT